MKIIPVLASVLLLASPLMATKRYGDLEFQTNIDSLLQVSRDSNQTMLIKFYTDW